MIEFRKVFPASPVAAKFSVFDKNIKVKLEEVPEQEEFKETTQTMTAFSYYQTKMQERKEQNKHHKFYGNEEIKINPEDSNELRMRKAMLRRIR